jgi:hypothetical protein
LLCTLRIERGAVDRFDGPAGADWTVTLPPTALYASDDAASGLAASFDPERRVLQGQALVEPGGHKTVKFALMVAPDADGTRLSVRASVATEQSTYLVATAEVQARRPVQETGANGTAGALLVTTAGWWVLGFLLTGPLFVGVCALRGGPRPGVLGLAFAAWAGVGFMLVLAAMARHDARLWFDYQKADCVVTDTGQHTRASGKGRHATNISEPFVALRFELGGQHLYGVGFDSGSHLRAGGHSWPAKELQSFGPGAAVPCWYDPQDPAHAIVVRGPGGAYLFALLPLGLLWGVARPLGRALMRRR